MKPPTQRRILVLPDYLKAVQVPVAFIDADSTLRVSKRGKPAPNSPEDVMIIPGTGKQLKQLIAKKYLLVIISNQGGVESGFLSLSQANLALAETVQAYWKNSNIFFCYYDFAEKRDHNRKPQTNMATRFENKLNEHGYKIDWNNSFMIGDAGWKKDKDLRPNGLPGKDHSNSDRLFAENIMKKHKNFKFHHAADFFQWQKNFGTESFDIKLARKYEHYE